MCNSTLYRSYCDCLLLPAIFYYGPLNAFYSSDHGVKLFQTQSLILTKFRSQALMYPGESIDPKQRFTPFRGQYLVRNHQSYGMLPEAKNAESKNPISLLIALAMLTFRGHMEWLLKALKPLTQRSLFAYRLLG